MASFRVRTTLQHSVSSINRNLCSQCRRYATPSRSDLANTPPPLLLKLRKDLKTAIVEKDMNRLNVLRALIADVTNSAKQNNPVKTDMQLLSMLRKRQAAAKQASDEFKAAGRQDLVDKEEGQANVLEEYAGSVETMSDDDVREIVVRAVDEAKAEQPIGKVNMGEILKKLLSPGGSFDGKPVDRKEVSKIVKDVLTMS